LPLALVPGILKEVSLILGRELRDQQSHCREVYGPITEQVEDDGVLSRGPGGLDTAVGSILGEMEHLHTVGERRRAAFSKVQLSLVQHGKVGNENRRRLTLPPGKEFHARDDILIGELTNKERSVVFMA
jgi:hypothetical protein